MTSTNVQPGAKALAGFVSAADLSKRPSGLNMLLYGASDAGKTVLACGLARVVQPVLLINVDDSWGSLPALPGLYPEAVPQGPEGWTHVSNLVRRIEAGELKPAGIVVDSLTRLQDLAVVNSIMTGKSGVKKRGTTVYLPDKSDWTVRNRMVLDLVLRLRALARQRGIHVILTALESEEKDDAGAWKIRPRLSPALASEVHGYLDDVGRMAITREGLRGVRFKSTADIAAKHRHDPDQPRRLPETMLNPTMDQIFDLLTKENNDG